MRDRASGHLEMGELAMRTLNFERGIAEYQTAWTLDSSALSNLSLAQAFQQAGRLDEAAAYAKDLLTAETASLSWMQNYGIDIESYRRDIHEVLYKSYRGMAKRERYYPAANPIEKLFSAGRRIKWAFKWRVHEMLFRKYAEESANLYRKEERRSGEILRSAAGHIDALNLYFQAFRKAAWLRPARKAESALIPGAAPWYDYEEGAALNKAALLIAAARNADPVWERDLQADAWSKLAELSGLPRAERRAAAETAFAMNRGALLQNGVLLSCAVIVEENEPRMTRMSRMVLRLLNAYCFDNSGGQSRYVYHVMIDQSEIRCSLEDRESGKRLYEKTFEINESAELHKLVLEMQREIYTE
jgi:hypothetical protein